MFEGNATQPDVFATGCLHWEVLDWLHQAPLRRNSKLQAPIFKIQNKSQNPNKLKT
jgi:hypothetical protein